MASKDRTSARAKRRPIDVNEQSAHALLAATFEFLRRNNIASRSIVNFTREYHSRDRRGPSVRLYRELVRTYDDMGLILATWFSDPRFLDASGNPLPLAEGKGAKSIARLIRASGARVNTSVAIDLMKQSPSIKIDRNGMLLALRRFFVLPKYEIPRAAFVVERYLDTLHKNRPSERRRQPLLLQRSAYVSEVNLATVAPMLRDIDDRGSAFMDAVDGDIEGLRLRRSQAKRVGELGVVVFAWTKPRNQSKTTPKRARSPPR